MFMVALATVFLLVFLPLSVRQKGLVPRGMRNLIESVCEYLRENVARPILGDHTDTYVGFIWSVFFFILCLNLLPMVPTDKIVQLITGRENHFGGPATANIWITGAMASVVFFMTLICGIRQQGLWRFLANLAPPVPWWISPLIYALEIVAAFVRPFALAIRLFANMVAGHAVLAAFLGLIFVFRNYGVAVASVLSTVALSFLELLVAFVQAYIFTLLAALYIGFSIEPEH
jgi:F-type H+-transporting ATPase subunit a